MNWPRGCGDWRMPWGRAWRRHRKLRSGSKGRGSHPWRLKRPSGVGGDAPTSIAPSPIDLEAVLRAYEQYAIATPKPGDTRIWVSWQDESWSESDLAGRPIQGYPLPALARQRVRVGASGCTPPIIARIRRGTSAPKAFFRGSAMLRPGWRVDRSDGTPGFAEAVAALLAGMVTRRFGRCRSWRPAVRGTDHRGRGRAWPWRPSRTDRLAMLLRRRYLSRTPC